MKHLFEKGVNLTPNGTLAIRSGSAVETNQQEYQAENWIIDDWQLFPFVSDYGPWPTS